MSTNDFRLGKVVGIVSKTLGASVALLIGLLLPTSSEAARTAGPPGEPTIEQRVEVVRQRYLRESKPGDAETTAGPRSPGSLAQWYNWPNWPNYWGNWPNWRNW
ncbi:MAG: hypothetical protein ACREF4_02750 [Gammaproteobacteria bacterium]